ncbi:efflux RND transporter permease subunit [Amylibacter sp.]|nr:efflux RND transporter permease subunit [Amylibacter sp.]
MTGMIDWATDRARMILVFVAMSLAAGILAYTGLPKEGEPDIDIPALFVSVPFPGISAEDSEKLIVKPLENKLRDINGLKTMSSTASEGYGGVALEFEFGWDKSATIADVRDKANQAQAEFPVGADQYSINEINFSRFPILVVSMSGQLPERTMTRVAKNLQDRIESMTEVLEVGLAGQRDEMLEVLIDPLKLEAYNVTAGELISVVTNNNLLIAAGEIENEAGAFAIKIPSSFNEPKDVYNLPVKVNGNRVITLEDLADIRLTFEDRVGTARFNGETTVTLQIIKRKGVNLISTVSLVKAKVEQIISEWEPELRDAITIDFSSDQSRQVSDMVSQLEGSVLTAIALVMIVVLAALGIRSALLVGFAIPTSFLLAFALMGISGITISNMVMFGLILAVGMLVDGAIVVVEYADKRIAEGTGPMEAYGSAAKRMFWPIVSSTATTLCAFLPMLFWPGVPGEFMRMLPITLIYVLSASLLVALIYLPVIGGVAGRLTRILENISNSLRNNSKLIVRLLLVIVSIAVIFAGVIQLVNGIAVIGALLFFTGCMATSATTSSLKSISKSNKALKPNLYARLITLIVNKWYMPAVMIGLTIFFLITVFSVFGKNNNGVEFFVTTEPENAIVYVRARGNLSLAEKDILVENVEGLIKDIDGIQSAFAFAGDGGLDNNTGGATAPLDTIGQIQIETTPWEARQGSPSGFDILKAVEARIADVPGVQVEILELAQGPASGKPLTLRVKGSNFDDLKTAAGIVRDHYETIDGPIKIEDTRPLPGIDWQVDVDVEKAGRYKADVAQVGAMVQLVTRGLKLGDMTVDTSDEDIDIRVRLPKKDRLLSTLETLRVRTNSGLIPISNFITLRPVEKLGQIDRDDSKRYFDIKADVAEGINAGEKIAEITKWLEEEERLPNGIEWEWKGDQEEQAESSAFLGKAFLGALGLMFVILLAQFNSFYNSALVLIAVVLSTAGVLIGMLVMNQAFSVIMTGTGIVALAGIVVNNNIVLIDTYQEYSKNMPALEAISKTAQARIRPVLLTTITTMAGLTPMMLGISIDFINGGYFIDQPTALWWKQLATAVVFGLGIATVLTLVLTPSLLALRVWVSKGAYAGFTRLFRLKSIAR